MIRFTLTKRALKLQYTKTYDKVTARSLRKIKLASNDTHKRDNEHLGVTLSALFDYVICL